MTEQLYLVIREPKIGHADWRAMFWSTRANSKAAAVRRFRELCRLSAMPNPHYTQPRAELVTVDGPPFYV